MTPSDRLEVLRREGERQRDALALDVGALRELIAARRARWRVAGMVAGGVATAGTVAYRLFSRNSPVARISRLTSAASLIFGLGRAVGRLRRFF